MRVSTVEQSFDRQLDGMSFDKVFEEKISGRTRERPALKNMLSYCREGDHIYVHSMDRLARNLRDLLDLVKEITDKGCTIHFVQQHLEFSNDDNNPTTKLMLQVIGGVAEFEAALIRSRVLEGIAAAKARGTYKSGRPVVMMKKRKRSVMKNMQLEFP
ncbi:MAG: recombinase family protein [Succinivibrio dextrinosolvens]|nr:recombinase family protein [Succinivibrio dextrinosolvens]